MHNETMRSLTPAMVFAVVLAITPADSAHLSGHWRLDLDPGFNDEPATLRCQLAQEGEAFTLECDSVPTISGTLEERTVKFVIMTGQDNLLPARFSGRLDASDATIEGTWRLEDTTGNRIGRFKAAKQ